MTAQVRADGEHHTVVGEGSGPISAFVKGLRAEFGTELDVVDYAEHAIGRGAEATAAAYVESVADDGGDGPTTRGASASTRTSRPPGSRPCSARSSASNAEAGPSPVTYARRMRVRRRLRRLKRLAYLGAVDRHDRRRAAGQGPPRRPAARRSAGVVAAAARSASRRSPRSVTSLADETGRIARCEHRRREERCRCAAAFPDAITTRTDRAWVAPVDGACPLTHPVKANANSGIYHVPGGRFYDRTRPSAATATPRRPRPTATVRRRARDRPMSARRTAP